jgi:D-ribose pyranase
MKKTLLLNISLSQLVASLGHGDIVVIGDAGLPVPPGVPLIDLALSPGIPSFVSTLEALLSEMQVESHVVAEEMLQVMPQALGRVQQLHEQGTLGVRQSVSHARFKELSQRARAIVRTGECEPYSNIALLAGVTF